MKNQVVLEGEKSFIDCLDKELNDRQFLSWYIQPENILIYSNSTVTPCLYSLNFFHLQNYSKSFI